MQHCPVHFFVTATVMRLHALTQKKVTGVNHLIIPLHPTLSYKNASVVLWIVHSYSSLAKPVCQMVDCIKIPKIIQKS